MTTASGMVMVDRYEISLSIFGPAGLGGPGFALPTWNVTGFVQQLPGGIQALLGMDLIRQLTLHVDGPKQVFTLGF